MSMRMLRRAAVALAVVGMLAGCKRDKPTEPPNDDEPDPTADVRAAMVRHR